MSNGGFISSVVKQTTLHTNTVSEEQTKVLYYHIIFLLLFYRLNVHFLYYKLHFLIHIPTAPQFTLQLSEI